MLKCRKKRLSARFVSLLLVLLCFGNAALAGYSLPASGTPVAEAVPAELTYYDPAQFATDETGTEAEALPASPELFSVPYTSPADSPASPPPAAGGIMTVEELRKKFPEGKYWNHADNPGAGEDRSNPDGWTDLPCPYHDDNDNGYFRSGITTCNTFYVNGSAIGSQCHGFAAKLAWDATGTSINTWPKITDPETAVSAVKPGDVIRINDDHHTIYVIDVRYDEIMYADCNNGHQCAIHWDQRMSKQDLLTRFTYLRQSPYVLSWGGAGPCWCSGDKAGQYVTNRSVELRAGHGTGYDAIAVIPSGDAVEVTRGDDYYAHATWNGISGILPASALSRYVEPPQIIPSYTGCNLSVPGSATFDLNIYCLGNLPERFSVGMAAPDNTPGFFKVEFLRWEGTTAMYRITALAGGRADLSFRIIDNSCNAIMAACTFRINAKEETATMAADQGVITGLDLESNPSRTITLTAGGYIPGSYYFTLWASSGDNFKIEWVGEWYNRSHDVKITATRPGTGKAVFALVSNDHIRASVEVTINIQGDIQSVPQYTSVLISSSDGRSLPFSIRFYGNFPSRVTINSSHDTNSFRLENLSLAFSPSGQPLTFDVTFVPLKAGTDTVRFTLSDISTGNALTTVTLSVTVVDKPVYWIQYDPMGGSGGTRRHLLTDGRLVTDKIPVRENYMFDGWTDTPGSHTVLYRAGDPFGSSKDMTLYAVWGPILPDQVLRLPEDMVTVEEEAFAGADIRSVVIGENCDTVGPNAFADNIGLSVVAFYGKNTFIDESAFSGCGNLVVYGRENSAAESFAVSGGYTFYPLD